MTCSVRCAGETAAAAGPTRAPDPRTLPHGRPRPAIAACGSPCATSSWSCASGSRLSLRLRRARGRVRGAQVQRRPSPEKALAVPFRPRDGWTSPRYQRLYRAYRSSPAKSLDIDTTKPAFFARDLTKNRRKIQGSNHQGQPPRLRTGQHARPTRPGLAARSNARARRSPGRARALPRTAAGLPALWPGNRARSARA